jgi:hypothetical protein
MNDQDHSLSLSDPDRSLVLSHLLVNFLKNLVSCQTSLSWKPSQLRPREIYLALEMSKEITSYFESNFDNKKKTSTFLK